MPERVAIVAIHPSDESIPFTLNLLEALATNDFYILVLHNKPLPDEQNRAVLSRCHHLIERFPIGRDFGAYKRGIEWTKQTGIIDGAKQLVLANDSMFYPAVFKDHLRQLIKRTDG